MKKIFIYVGSILFLINFYSCNEQNKELNSSFINDPYNTPPILFVPSNSNNPFDFVGELHNQYLNYFKENFNNEIDIRDSLAFWAEVENLTQQWASSISETYGLNQQDIDDALTYYMNDCLNHNGQEIIESLIYSSYFKSKAYELISLSTTIYNDNDTSINDYNVFISNIISFENDILDNQNLTSTEKQKLLEVSSIVRYSTYYWLNEYYNQNSQWKDGLMQCSINIINKKRPIVQYFEEQRNWPDEKKLAMTVAWDAIVGFGTESYLAGGIASGVCATILWWDDICDGASWLGEQIGDFCNWVVGLFS